MNSRFCREGNMKLINAALTMFFIVFLPSCLDGNRGTSRCRTHLSYKTNPYTQGDQAIRQASVYWASFNLGSSSYSVDAIIDTASGNLVVNQNGFTTGNESITGENPLAF